jgi:hypothetical protein
LGAAVRRVYITFGGARYDEITEHVVRDAPNLGCTDVFVYDDAWLEQQEFRRLNAWLWDHPGDPKGGKRGFGWYAWKSFVIQHALSRVDDGDVVLYADGDSRPIADLTPVFDIAARDGAMLFAANPHVQRQWCTEQCLFIMGQDEPRYRDARAGNARWMAFRKGGWKEAQFLQEWLSYSVNRYATTFDPPHMRVEVPYFPNVPEHDFFTEHRTEQAIMTNLAHRYGYKLWRELDQDGDGLPDDRELYGRLFTQTHLGSGHAVQGSRFRRIP